MRLLLRGQRQPRENSPYLFGEATPPQERFRNDALTSTTLGDYETNLRPVLPRLFDQADAMFLGVDMQTIAGGTAHYPIMTGGDSAGARAKGAAKNAVAATFTVENLAHCA